MATKQKVVLLLDLQGNDAKEKRKVLKAVSTYPGLDLIAVDMKERKLMVVGLVDPIELVTKLRKHWRAYIFFVGPAKDDVPAGVVAGDSKEDGAAADVSSWPPHAVVFPARYPYPYHPNQYVAGDGHGGAQEDPHGYHYVAGGGLGTREHHDHPNTYVAHGGHGARGEDHPNYYYAAHGYGAQENSHNGCAIC